MRTGVPLLAAHSRQVQALAGFLQQGPEPVFMVETFLFTGSHSVAVAPAFEALGNGVNHTRDGNVLGQGPKPACYFA